MSRQGLLVKNTLILSFGSVVPKFVNIVTLPILTGFLSKTDYGTYDLVVSMVTLLLPVATLQMQAAAFRFLIDAREDRGRQKAIVTNIVVTTTVLSLVVLAVVFCMLSSLPVIVRTLVCGYYLLDILVATLRQVARGVSKNGVYSVSVIVNSLAEGLAIVGFVMLVRGGLNGALVASVIGQAASLVILVFGVRVYSFLDLKTLSIDVVKGLVAYSWPLIPNSLSNWAISMSDRLILTVMMGIEASAVYAAATKVPNMLGILQLAFNLAWQENASIASEDDDRGAYYTRMFDAVFRLSAGGLGLLLAASPLIFALLIQGDYAESYVHMNILFVGALASSVSSFLGGIYIARMKTKEIGATTVAAAVVNIVAEVVFVPAFGIFAASFAYTSSFVALAIFRAWRLRSFEQIGFNRGLIIGVACVLIVMAILGAWKTPLTIAANIVIGLVLFVVLNHSLLAACFKKFRRRNP